jgi:membrane protease YdiL (CAAX protease family)
MNTNGRQGRSPLWFFVWVVAISIPFWIIGAVVEQYLPKDRLINLPLSSLMTFNPMIVALILIHRESGMQGVKALLKRVFDFKRIRNRVWYLPIFLLMPLIMVVEYIVMILTGNPIPDPQVELLMAPVLFVAFFIAAVGEELGWQGYAFEPLQTRWNALGAALILGVVWALIHIVPDFQMNHTLTWIIAQRLGTVALRVLIVWIYNNTGQSLFAAITLHAMNNVSTFLFPNNGSYFDPVIAFFIMGLIAVSVVIAWGPKTLARYRF